MKRVARLWGLGASVAGTTFQLGVIAATVPVFPYLVPCLHCGELGPVFIPRWTPVIENPGVGDLVAEVSRCPGLQTAGTSFRLDRAPLPPAFRPFDQESMVLACVRVDAAGSVASVRLMSGTGKAGLDRQLLRTIGRDWRFTPQGEVPARPGWQRVRLSPGPDEALMYASPPME